jgi:hypothetical protein
MTSYQNGKIYSIRSHSRPDLIYIGSTTQALSKRFGKHKAYNDCSSKQIIDLGDSYIELVEEFKCENKEQLNRREGEIQRSMECVNKYIAGRTTLERYQENKENISVSMKQYYIDNKEEILTHRKKYYTDNKETISTRKKQYVQDNKDKIASRRKQYKRDNKEAILASAKQYYQEKKEMRTCICGTEYNCGVNQKRNNHYATKTHQKHIQLIYEKLRSC